MMRRAGTLPENMIRSISKSYCSACCLEGQISVDLGPGATRPRSGFFFPHRRSIRAVPNTAPLKGVTGHRRPMHQKSKEDTGMDFITKMFVKAQNWQKGQTMTEYSLIVLFVGIAAYAAYTGVGLGVKAVANNLVTFISTAVAAL